ncbi:MAG: hypothetical protein KTR31_26850 [Myxococcales bacterium]|nr:hypothetical protein [Myxococcales bacterium]
MLSVRTIAPILLLGACTPQNAELTSGSYVAFFSDGTSLSLLQEEVDPSDPGWQESYIFDCRTFDDENPGQRIEDFIRVCGPNSWPPVHETWATTAGFRVVSEPLEPWRGEAVITAEGDLQISFHHRMTGGSDMRIIAVVDPDFQPTECLPKEGGGVERQPLDGDWVAEWSNELRTIAAGNDALRSSYDHMEQYLDDGTLFFLNAFGYQRNPRNVNGDFWFLPDQFEAGAARGKISEELLNGRRSIYSPPYVYNEIDDPEGDEGYTPDLNEEDLWFCDLAEGSDPNDSGCMDDLTADVEGTADTIHEEVERWFKPEGADGDEIFTYRPVTHLNKWRAPDGVPAGFDGWGELHYSYVVFSGDSDLTPGGRAEGAFSLVLEAQDSPTTVFTKGQFVIERIKQDRWVTDDLRQEKADENEVDLCFQQ